MAAVSCHIDRKMTSQPSTREENVLSVQRAAVMQGGGKEGQPGYPGALVLAPQTELAPWLQGSQHTPCHDNKACSFLRLPQSGFHSCNQSPRAYPVMPNYLLCVHSSRVTRIRRWQSEHQTGADAWGLLWTSVSFSPACIPETSLEERIWGH